MQFSKVRLEKHATVSNALGNTRFRVEGIAVECSRDQRLVMNPALTESQPSRSRFSDHRVSTAKCHWTEGPSPCFPFLSSTMHRFRKKPSSSGPPSYTSPSTPTPPITEYIKQELATFHPQKDRRALAATSSAVALSILPQSPNSTDPVPDEPESKESAWRAAYGAAEIAVDIAKDSSDMLPPLKAVAVALSVLIKNYDVRHPPASCSMNLSTADGFQQQTTANTDQIREVEERVQSLDEILTNPVDGQDSHEKARREALRRFVPFP